MNLDKHPPNQEVADSTDHAALIKLRESASDFVEKTVHSIDHWLLTLSAAILGFSVIETKLDGTTSLPALATSAALITIIAAVLAKCFAY